ncbi:AMP-dependent synthetase/ligase [Actinoalloteichus hymeniacidonis]|uniref:AMP-forming long-chain acyl-CoA synthetase n=1 Tax=Actinoalloteichus hymeniacidonis TaxID=340345 RepID=A0AAC9HWI9_9PSEU|nr:AMP-dependent synthetase/ligase [Actinoalloteichus hymeniacidonis]AOS65780.1 AMP-forming long-chain acyl-CoA synthetase [Actinoalloteichus hymeniacidonis]MBB5906129.1 long-chain acyl-CoA synthetase [Actinoalloteichus hymeniacidonis]
MTELSVPPLATAPAEGGLADIIYLNATEAPNKVVFNRKTGDVWSDVTTTMFRDEVTAVAKGLVAAGIKQGDRVALLARTRYEWTLLDFAIWTAGAITVPVYATSSKEQIRWILSDSGAVAAVVENQANADDVEVARSELSDLTTVWQIEDGAVDAMIEAGKDVPDEELTKRRKAVKIDDPATIIYTSGTTGRPKGCILTHANFFAEVDNAIAKLPQLFTHQSAELPEPVTLLFLPVAHVFGRMVQVAVARARVRTAHTPDIVDLTTDLQAIKPTFILSVPHVFEKVFNRAQRKAKSEGKGAIFDLAAKTAIAYSKALDAGRPSLLLKGKHLLFDKLVFSKLRTVLGGKVRYAISGGAPLGERLSHFYRGIGLHIFEGYGLTETTAAAVFNTPDKIKLGTVGQPMPGTSLRIAADGELLLKGGVIFREYWNNPTASAEAFTDGWFATGDLGELDSDGYLRITGRKKEILVTAGGKNVAPAGIEDVIRGHALVSQALVVGDAKPFIAALITIDLESFPQWKSEHDKPADATVADLAEDPDLIAAVQEAVDAGNEMVSRAESVRKFRILTSDFTIEDGHVTPSLKLRRAAITTDFAAEIAELYRK